VPRLQQGLKFRAEPSERAKLPLFLPSEGIEIELAMSRLLRFSRAFFCCKALLFFPPALSLLYLLSVRETTGQSLTQVKSNQKRKKKKKRTHFSLPLLSRSLIWICHRATKSR
jgi:hypothetical protein